MVYCTAVHNEQCSVLKYALYSVQCRVLQCTEHRCCVLQCTEYGVVYCSVQSILYTVQCTASNVQRTTYNTNLFQFSCLANYNLS